MECLECFVCLVEEVQGQKENHGAFNLEKFVEGSLAKWNGSFQEVNLEDDEVT